jgi:hypothetical protein
VAYVRSIVDGDFRESPWDFPWNSPVGCLQGQLWISFEGLPWEISISSVVILRLTGVEKDDARYEWSRMLIVKLVRMEQYR